MRILLVWPKARTDPEWGGDLGAIAEPLALEYLAAGAAEDGHEIKILDLRLNPLDLDATLTSFCPDVVGVTAFTMHVSAALSTCARAKVLAPNCRTVVGGHHATFLPEDFFEPHVDFVVSGEGVIPFRHLLRALEQERAPSDIPGLFIRSDRGHVAGPPRSPFGFGDLPTPDRSITRGDRGRYFIDWMTPVACVRSSVGCPYRCTFCSLWKITDGHYIRRPIESFVAEVATIEEPYVFLIDDEAFVNGKRMVAIADSLAAADVRRRFFAYARVDTIIREQEALAAWTRQGLDRLLVGIDGAFDRDLVMYNKGYTAAEIERALDVARNLGIEIFAQFVVDTNYTRRDFERLARFVEHHRIAYPSFTVLTPLPGTTLLSTFDRVVARQANGRPNWDLFDTQNAVTQTALPPEEFRRAYRDLFRRFGGAYSVYRSRARAIPSAVQ